MFFPSALKVGRSKRIIFRDNLSFAVFYTLKAQRF